MNLYREEVRSWAVDVGIITVAGMEAAMIAALAIGVRVMEDTTTEVIAAAAGLLASGDTSGPRRNSLPGWSSTLRTCRKRPRPSKSRSPR